MHLCCLILLLIMHSANKCSAQTYAPFIDLGRALQLIKRLPLIEKNAAATSNDETDAEVVEHILASRSRASLDVGSPVEQGIETARSVL